MNIDEYLTTLCNYITALILTATAIVLTGMFLGLIYIIIDEIVQRIRK